MQQLQQPFVSISKMAYKAWQTKKDSFHKWMILHSTNRNNEFKEDTIDVVIEHYSPIQNEDDFVDLQLKFFLVRNSTNPQNLSQLLKYWVSLVRNKFPSNSNILYLALQENIYFEALRKYGKYYYDQNDYIHFVEQWNNRIVDLNTWKKFKYLSLPNDFYFLKPIFEKKGEFKFPVEHMKKLFDEYTEEVYQNKVKPRLLNKILAETDKSSIERILQNSGTEDDKKHINKLVTKFYHRRTLSENLFECLTGTIYPAQMDINSPDNYAGYFALIKYYNALKGKRVEKKAPAKAMWFKNKKDDNKNELNEALKDVFDMIKIHCPGSDWSDFKNIFNKNGSSTKIEWTGSAQLLNFIFRKLDNVMVFQGGKWNAVEHYFYPGNKSKTSLKAKNLQGSSHFTESNNIELANRLNDIISILTD